MDSPTSFAFHLTALLGGAAFLTSDVWAVVRSPSSHLGWWWCCPTSALWGGAVRSPIFTLSLPSSILGAWRRKHHHSNGHHLQGERENQHHTKKNEEGISAIGYMRSRAARLQRCRKTFGSYAWFQELFWKYHARFSYRSTLRSASNHPCLFTSAKSNP